MNSLVLLDIDGTLFDPEHFGILIRGEFIKILGTTEDDLMRTIADYYANLEMSTDFSPREISVFIAQRYKVDSELLDKVFWGNTKIYKDSLYPEAEGVVQKLSSSKKLGIFSQGNKELQKHKLEACNLLKYFENEYIFIHRRKGSDEAIALLPREATVVDDNHDLILTIAPFVDAIWVNRRTEDSDPNVQTIHSLSELITNN